MTQLVLHGDHIIVKLNVIILQIQHTIEILLDCTEF
jgi:hypothetical protein